MFPGKLQLDQGGSLALIFLQNGGTDLISIKSIVGKFFKTKYGDFQLNAHLAYGWGKKRLYFYYQGYANPLDIQSVVKIVNFLKSVEDPVLRETDLDNQTIRDALGYDVLQFLDAFRYVDEDAIEHALDMPLRSEKKNMVLSSSLVAIPPSPMPPNVGLYVTKDRKIEMIKLKVERKPEGLIAKSKVGDFDLSDKKARHVHGKSNVYVLLEGQRQAVYLNVSTFLPDFVPYEPIAIMDTIEDIKYANRTVQAALKRADKKGINLMLIMIIVIGGVIAWQVVVNPQLGKIQTQQQLDQINKNKLAEQDKVIQQKELELKILQAQQHNKTADTPVISEH